MTAHSQILDGLPFAIFGLDGENISYTNRLFRSLFASAPNTLSTLVQQFPELTPLLQSDGISATRPLWLTVAASSYCVVKTAQGDLLQYVFLPGWLAASTEPGMLAMQKNLDDFVEIFENCFDGIYVADGEGRTLWMNAGFERCYGLSARNFLGRDASKLELEGYVDPLITWKIISTKQRQTALQTTKSGRKVLATGIPLFAPDGSVRRVIINARDTTELVEIQDKLNAAEEEIRGYETELRQIREVSGQDGSFSWFSDDMQSIVSLAMRVGRTDAAICISGPSGVGKRKLADLVFRHSKRERKRLMRVTFGDLPEAALMSDLFGHGAGPREDGLLARATGGTLLLERIDLMPLSVQKQLSSWLRDRQETLRASTPDIRLISTHQADLSEMVKEGTLREDLYFRLNVVGLSIPPLGPRSADIVGLAQHFLTNFNTSYKVDKQFEAGGLNRLVNWHWPGNVRELRTVIERLVATETASGLSAASIDRALYRSSGGAPLARDVGETLQSRVRQFEASLLREEIASAGSIAKAAKATGISVSTIKRKLNSAKTSQ